MLSDGQGEMKGQILRIAHIGYLDYLDCIAIIAGLEQVLAQLKPASFQYGDGLRAAQLVYAEARQNGEKPVKIVVAEKIAAAAMKVLEAIPDSTVITPEQFALDPVQAVSDADALIVRSAVQADAALIEAARIIRVIGRAGVGVDNIDVEVATRRGIVVMNAPGASAVSVAELTLGLMIAMARHIPRADQTTRAGKWEKKSLQGTELAGKTLGIIGLGRIGTETALRAQAFGMKLVGSDPYLSPARAKELGIELVSIDALYAQADYISLHVALTHQTAGMINAEAIAKMKPGVRLVNCARGELVDEAAVEAALQLRTHRRRRARCFPRGADPQHRPALGAQSAGHAAPWRLHQGGSGGGRNSDCQAGARLSAAGHRAECGEPALALRRRVQADQALHGAGRPDWDALPRSCSPPTWPRST